MLNNKGGIEIDNANNMNISNSEEDNDNDRKSSRKVSSFLMKSRKSSNNSTPPVPPKSIHEHTRRGYAIVVMMGLCMAFSAGYTNGVCLSGFVDSNEIITKQSVAGVTGVYTNSAIFFSSEQIDQAAFQIGIIFSVMLGGFIAALMNPYPVAFEISPRFAPTFLIASLFMILGAIEPIHNERREFYFTAIGNGIQNGISSMYSANLLRTSHLTGTTTDIGLFMGMAIRGNRTNNWKLYILIGLALSFWTGSFAGYFAAKMKFQFSLLFNAIFFLVISMCVVVRTCYYYRVPVWQAILGVGKWSTTLDEMDIFQSSSTRPSMVASKRSLFPSVNDAESPADIDELMALFDEIDSDNTGTVCQHKLIAHLTSNHCKVHTKRKKLSSILFSAFLIHDDGDFQITRSQWRDLVDHSEQVEQLSKRNITLGASAIGPSELRRMSIQALKK